MSFYVARDHCSQLGGWLFDNFTIEALTEVSHNLSSRSIGEAWVGAIIQREDPPVFVNTAAEILNLTNLWNTGYPIM